MKKINAVVQSMAIKKAARGLIGKTYNAADRARTVYGLSNFALQKSPDELRNAWITASQTVRNKR